MSWHFIIDQNRNKVIPTISRKSCPTYGCLAAIYDLMTLAIVIVKSKHMDSIKSVFTRLIYNRLTQLNVIYIIPKPNIENK